MNVQQEIHGPFDDDGRSPFQRAVFAVKREAERVSNTALALWNKQPLWGKALIVALGLCGVLLGILFLIYHEYLLQLIVKYSEEWEPIPWVPLVLMGLLFIISFPPVIGFSFVNTVVGAVYGITFKGWFIIAFSSITGSVAAFVLFRYALKSKAQVLIHANPKLLAFSSVLQDHNSFWLLALIRVCPFPYSLCNGALAAIPGVTVLNFFLGSFISSPKLVMYLFVGQKVKDIGKATDTLSRVVDILSIIGAIAVLTFTSWLLFTKTTERLKEIEQRGALDEEDDLERQLSGDYEDALSLHTQEERYSD
jgi:uncharacterized membrane protein YdjX (TVP38/TMEM64 family)